MRLTVKMLVPALAAGAMVLAQVPASEAATPVGTVASKTVRISLSSSGAQPNNISGRSSRPAVNTNGQVVAFDSIANNLVANDTNHEDDVFVRDRTTGKTTRVSVSSSGKQGNGASSRPSVSGNGNLVAFDSGASNLVPDDTNHVSDVFVHNRASGETILVSRGLNSAIGNGSSFGPVVSQNGRYVVFPSDATNLVSEPVTPFDRQIYLRDLQTGRMELESLTTEGEAAGGGAFGPSVSADGRYVAYASISPNIVAGDTNDAFDIFVRDRVLGTTVRASVSSSGAQSEGGSSAFTSISGDGRYVAFSSTATNLVPGDTNDTTDIFVHDLQTGATERVNVGPGGVQANRESDGPGFRGGTSFGPSISADGRYVTFDSIASNLVADDTNTCEFVGGPSFPEPGECPDIFVRDRTLDVTTRVSVDSAGAQANDASTDPSISFDGRSVVFFTAASNLVAGDTNTCPPFFFGHRGACPDIYLHHS
jgi:hypothetical protein